MIWTILILFYFSPLYFFFFCLILELYIYNKMDKLIEIMIAAEK